MRENDDEDKRQNNILRRERRLERGSPFDDRTKGDVVVTSRLSHLFMPVTDLAGQLHLFVDVLGLELLINEGGYARVGGNGGFHIGMEEGSSRASDDVEIVIAVDDVDATYKRLLSEGIVVDGPPQSQEWGTRHVWFRDVDGRRISAFSTES